ncbi:YndJ family protein [Desmospora activa]|uniref:YndJ-like protein n=1 Tax=Desmospora activa DSM 45169 TaxID=1121389 RepID=A0A2T4Z7W2_9BACL|nr:YndJ family protein [Desmospora activa]PTM57982.1 YndJ-like protein [Desmospora activa DSM 45169]
MVNERKSAGIGAIIWTVFVVIKALTTNLDSLQYVMILLLFAYLVLVPLTLSLVADRSNRFYRWAVTFQPFAAVAAGISFFLSPGVTATLWAVPWLLVTMLIALYGFTRFLQQKRSLKGSELLIQIGLMYIVVGGGWLVLHRTGMPVLHFSDIIVLLTSIHFHYAAFLTPITMGIVGKKLLALRPGLKRLWLVMTVAIILGPGFVAVGITFGNVYPLLEFIAVVEFVLPLLLYALLLLFVYVPHLPNRPAQALFTLSAISLLFSMGASFFYGYGHIGDYVILDIPLMIFVHGFVNTFGFSLCAILGLQRSGETAALTVKGEGQKKA